MMPAARREISRSWIWIELKGPSICRGRSKAAPIASWWFMNVVGGYGSATSEKLTFDTFRQGEPVPGTFECGRDRGIFALQ